MAVKVIADTAPEPLDLAFVKGWLKLQPGVIPEEVDALEDAILLLCMKAARKYCEQYRGVSMKPKTVQAQVPYRNTGFTNLPFGPVISITSVNNPEGITIISDAELGSTWLAEYLKGMSINNTYAEDFGGLGYYGYSAINYLDTLFYTVTYEAGYAAEELPEHYKMAILKMTAEFYLNRENTVLGMTVVAQLPLGVKALLDVDKESVLF